MSLASLDLGGSGGNAFPFDSVGDSVTGKILGLEEVQQTDMDNGQPAVWDNGQPKMMYRVELQTDLRSDAGDDGKRSIYLKGSRKPESKSSLAAVLSAVRQSVGGSSLAVGGTLTVTYSGEGEPTKRGWNPPKHYSATYTAPSVDIGEPAPAGTPAPAQAAPQQQASAAPQVQWTDAQIAAARAAGVQLPGM